jgi:hypothetical protein
MVLFHVVVHILRYHYVTRPDNTLQLRISDWRLVRDKIKGKRWRRGWRQLRGKHALRKELIWEGTGKQGGKRAGSQREVRIKAVKYGKFSSKNTANSGFLGNAQIQF